MIPATVAQTNGAVEDEEQARDEREKHVDERQLARVPISRCLKM